MFFLYIVQEFYTPVIPAGFKTECRLKTEMTNNNIRHKINYGN